MRYNITTPINVMNAEAGIIDIENRIELVTRKYIIKKKVDSTE